MSIKISKVVLNQLQNLYSTMENDGELSRLVNARDNVISKYQKVFSLENIVKLSEDEIKEFLMFKNNMHWIGLHRMGGFICKDMNKTRDALTILLDENKDIVNRLNILIPQNGENYVKGLAKAILTPILLIIYPAKYSIWNNIVEQALRNLELWPAFEKKMSFGDKYKRINELQLSIAKELSIDTWTLDALWWRVAKPLEQISEDNNELSDDTLIITERFLHLFIVENWEKTEFGKEWMIYEEDGMNLPRFDGQQVKVYIPL